MVCSISTKWKQPVGHFFNGNSVDSTVLKTMILQLESYGTEVCALVCDLETSHRSGLSAVGVTADNPQFISSAGNVIHVMHDRSHCFIMRGTIDAIAFHN